MIEIDNAYKEYDNSGKRSMVLDRTALKVEKGEFLCLLGPSGCGKTTLLSLMAGFEKPAGGQIKINGRTLTGPDIRYVTIFQSYGLLPWRTVLANVELGLEALNYNRQQRREIAQEYLELVGLIDFQKHHPHQLSGGMQQRVAIARALAVDPQIIFMDEPFGALDAITRMRMQEEISAIWEKKKITVVFVTHDIDEAVFLGERIAIMTPYPGRIKTVMKVELTGKRDRTQADFLRIRDKVFENLEMKGINKLEYYL